MSTVRLKFLLKELKVVRLWNIWTRKSLVSNVVRRYLKDRCVREVIQCFKYTILRPRRTLLLAATAYKFHDDCGYNCEQGISDDELQSLLLELENVQVLAKMTLYCTSCGKRLMIDRKQDGVRYCGCKEPQPAKDSSDGWIPYMETDDVIIWRKEYKPGKGLYAYKVYGRYPEISASDYAAVQVDGAYRRAWDSAVAALAVVERDAQGVIGQTVLHWEVLWPRLFANRDYVYIRRHKEFEMTNTVQNKNQRIYEQTSVHSNAKRKSLESYSKGSDRVINKVFVIISKSCEHPDVPETKHAIRVSEYWSHMVVKTLNGTEKCGTEFVLTYYDEPATGGMPCGVAAWASSRAAPLYLARMRRAARDYRAWAAERDSQDLPDFVPLSPDQVNRDKDTSVLEEEDMEGGERIFNSGWTRGDEIIVQTSKQGPDMENSKSTQDQSTQTENGEPKDKGGDKKDSEGKDRENKLSKDIKDTSKEKKSPSSHEEENEKTQEDEPNNNNGWWRYLYPFYYFV